MEIKKSALDRDMIIGCAIMAMLASAGIIFSILFIFAISLQDCNMTYLITCFFVLGGILWGILLCRNC
ncbi:MAG: hypothetical protein K6B67_04005 [Lachnospiraceae bacterium]|nr:hypothetical protein [Lachnospiraceae bacterium]